jgi:hypothetical protein
MVQKIIIAGASITSSPWFTWADYLKDESGLPTVDLSRKGVGNEYIINSLVQNQKHLGPDSLVVMMLTNIDKWDVFVEGQRFDDLLGQKHAPIPIGSRSGFWCTGSWFPDYKKAYDELYYNVDYFCRGETLNIETGSLTGSYDVLLSLSLIYDYNNNF